jgi:signal transduction histidine kinase
MSPLPGASFLRPGAPGSTASASLLATGVALMAASLLPSEQAIGPLLVFLAAVACSAWWAGRAAGLVTTVLATLALDYFFESPRADLSPTSADTLWELVLFVVVALIVSSANGSLRAALARAEAAQAESERRRRTAAALHETVAALSSERALPEVLEAIAREASTVLGASVAALYRLEGPAGPLRLEAVVGIPGEAAPRTLALGRSWLGEAIVSQRPVAVANTHEALARRPGAASAREQIGRPYGAVLAMPLIARGQALGALGLYYAATRAFSDDDAALARLFGDEAALAIETAGLRAHAAVSAAAAERNRIARELHDSVAQALYGIGLGARTARALLDRDPARLAEPLDYVVTLAEGALSEMRALLIELRPEALASEGLVAVLERHADSVRARHGLEVVTALGGEPDAPLPTKEAAYRIAQEALHNAVQHARARRVEVRLAEEEACLRVEVADDGIGFDPTSPFPGHLGLRTMRERAEELGGRVEIESAPGAGARVIALLPAPRD